MFRVSKKLIHLLNKDAIKLIKSDSKGIYSIMFQTIPNFPKVFTKILGSKNCFQHWKL